MTADALPIDPDAVLWSSSEADRAGRPVIVLLHGYGSDEADLFGLAPYLPLDPAIASVRAPLREGPGFAWFPRVDGEHGNPEPSRVDDAARGILNWLDAHLPDAPVGLLGFSQGAAVALQLLRLAPERFDYAVTLSGFAASGPHPGDAELGRRETPVFWGRGTDDRVIPDAAIERTLAWLPDHAKADIRVYEGVGHSISKRELSDAAAFIQTQLDARG